MMGYILPINDYQYTNERNRITNSRRTAESVEKSYKAVLERHLQDQKGEYDRLNNKTTGNPNASQSVIIEGIDTISGKGKYFNETI